MNKFFNIPTLCNYNAQYTLYEQVTTASSIAEFVYTEYQHRKQALGLLYLFVIIIIDVIKDGDRVTLTFLVGRVVGVDELISDEGVRHEVDTHTRPAVHGRCRCW